jgi:hypothetical protein
MASGHDEEAGFWPGYVAAVAGLVQGLLIMAMALGISIYALGRLATAASAEAAAKDAEAAEAAAAATGAGPFPAAPPPLPAPLPAPPPLAARAPVPPPVSARQPVVATIGFTGDAVALPDSLGSAVSEMVARHQAQGAVRWRLALAAPLTDPRARRAGYLRLLATRRAMITAGVAADAITVALNDGDTAGAVVELQPIGADGAPLTEAR